MTTEPLDAPGLGGHGLIPDEHRYREAAVRHKRLDLANRRLDARISSLESLATQGTLLAGFGYTTLTREHDGDEVTVVDGVEVIENFYLDRRIPEVFIAFFASLSVGAAVWVVYLSGYAAIRARIAFLMGSDRRAAEEAIQVLRDTHERARDCFDLSLSSLVMCASVLVCSNLRWHTALLVIVTFLCFLADGVRFSKQIDARLSKCARARLPRPALPPEGAWRTRVRALAPAAHLVARRRAARAAAQVDDALRARAHAPLRAAQLRPLLR